MSQDAVREKTGRGWDEWFAILDAWGAQQHNHTEIARWLVEDQQVHGWWAQSITVAYEQARGMRAPGQRADGTFAVSATKTVPVPVERAFAAFTDDTERPQWLPDDPLRLRRTTEPKSLRADWTEDASQVVVTFTVLDPVKTRVAVEHNRLPDATAASTRKTYWRDALTQLHARLTQSP